MTKKKAVLSLAVLAFAAVISLALTGFTTASPVQPMAPEAASGSLSADPDVQATPPDMDTTLGPVHDIPCSPGDCIDPSIPNLACRSFSDGCHCSTAKKVGLCT